MNFELVAKNTNESVLQASVKTTTSEDFEIKNLKIN